MNGRESAPPVTPSAWGERPRKDRAFIADEGLRNAVRDGRPGFVLKVRLTSYRSLPLSCIEGVRLTIDGEEIDPATIVLTLNYQSYTLDEMPNLSHVWWFILDYAELFVPRKEPLAPGYHDIEGTLITVEPYATAGRFSHYNPCSKRLLLETGLEAQS